METVQRENQMIDQVGIARRSPYALALLRIVSGLIFLEHGTQKFFGFPAGESAGGGWALDNAGAFAGIIELVAGALIAVGLFTRPAALIASGTMAVAYWMAHAPHNGFPINNGGDAAILYCFVFLYLVFAGPGAWSIDDVRSRRSHAQVAGAES
jgi:putative oxidoreductase